VAVLLHILANPKPAEMSVSRTLAAEFFQRRQAFHPAETLVNVDLHREDVPYLDAVTASLLTPPSAQKDAPQKEPAPGTDAEKKESAEDGKGENAAGIVPASAQALWGGGEPPRGPSWALLASDRFSGLFVRAERIVITAPMWNFGPPAILKAWIDLIVRPGKTFEFTEAGPRPLHPGKKLLLIGSRGGCYGAQSPLRAHEFLESYCRALFPFLGVETIEAVWAEGTANPQSAEAAESLQLARRRLETLAETF